MIRNTFRRARRGRPSGSDPNRRGTIIVLTAILLIVFLAFVALSVDVAYMQLTKAELRSATDSAARAGGEALSRLQSTSLARQAAKDAAAANIVAGRSLTLADEDIVFGSTVMNASGAWSFTPNGAPTNSLRVLGRRTQDSASGSVGMFWGQTLGVEHFEPVQSATVVRVDRDLVIAVDRSSSMKLDLASTAQTMSTSDSRFPQPPHNNNSRWAAAQDAVDEFVDALDDTPQSEQVALVTWGSAGTWCGVSNTASEINQAMTSNADLINDGMDTVASRVFNGATEPSAGIDRAIAVLTDPTTARPFASKTVVFLTDGQRTVGPNSTTRAATAVANDIVVHTITFGAVFDVTEMQQLAVQTGGKHWHAPNAAALSDIFHEIAVTVPVVITE